MREMPRRGSARCAGATIRSTRVARTLLPTAVLAVCLLGPGCGEEAGGALGALSSDELALSSSDAPGAAPEEVMPDRAAVPLSSIAPGDDRQGLAVDFVVPVFPGLDSYSRRCDPFDDGADVCM